MAMFVQLPSRFSPLLSFCLCSHIGIGILARYPIDMKLLDQVYHALFSTDEEIAGTYLVQPRGGPGPPPGP